MDNDIEIRPAEVMDAHRIAELNYTALGYDYSLEDTRYRLENILFCSDDKLWVACCGGKVVGYIHGCAYECTYCAPLKDIKALAVDEKYRGQGLGRMLLGTLEAWAKEEGCAGVRLVSGVDRLGAHSFYLRCGYFVRKEQKNFVKWFKK